MFNKKERYEKIYKEFGKENESGILVLHTEYCREVFPDDIPLTPMSEYEKYCNAGVIDPKNVMYFHYYDKYFYVSKGSVHSEETIGEAIMAGTFDDCVDYFSETYDRFERALSILRGDKYLVTGKRGRISIKGELPND